MSHWQADEETITRDRALSKADPAPGVPMSQTRETLMQRLDKAIGARMEHLAKSDPQHFMELVRKFRLKRQTT